MDYELVYAVAPGYTHEVLALPELRICTIIYNQSLKQNALRNRKNRSFPLCGQTFYLLS